LPGKGQPAGEIMTEITLADSIVQMAKGLKDAYAAGNVIASWDQCVLQAFTVIMTTAIQTQVQNQDDTGPGRTAIDLMKKMGLN